MGRRICRCCAKKTPAGVSGGRSCFAETKNPLLAAGSSPLRKLREIGRFIRLRSIPPLFRPDRSGFSGSGGKAGLEPAGAIIPADLRRLPKAKTGRHERIREFTGVPEAFPQRGTKPEYCHAVPSKPSSGFARESAARNYPATGGNGDVRSPQTEAMNGLVK